jgi:S1-C subfamily serine protease
VAVDGQPVRVFSELMSYVINRTRPGQSIVLTVLREGSQAQVEIVLGERP